MEPSFFHVFSPGAVVEAIGPDATPFLQGQFSNDLSKAGPGGSVYGLWLDRKGKVLADSFALCRSEESYLLVSYFCGEASVLERLDAYLIMDEVELAGRAESYRGICLGGEAREVGLGITGLEAPPAGGWVEKGGVLAFWGRRGLEPSLEILYNSVAGEGASLFEKTLSALEEKRIVEVDATGMEAFAIEGAVPRIGKDFGPGDLPQEIGLERVAVSYDKGCYLGQEVMARIRSMGRIRKKLSKVRMPSSNTVVQLPIDLRDAEGKRRGELRAVAQCGDGLLGLAVVAVGLRRDELTAGGVPVILDTEGESDG